VNYITGLIFCKEELNIFKNLLQRLVKKVEDVYENVFIEWDGDLQVFQPIESICNDIFKTTTECIQ